MDVGVQSRDPRSTVHLITTFFRLEKADRSFQHHWLTGLARYFTFDADGTGVFGQNISTTATEKRMRKRMRLVYKV